MNRIQRIATASAIGAAVLVPATGAAVAVATSDPGPLPESSSLSQPHSGPGRLHVADERMADQTALNSDTVPWAAIGLAAVAGATVTAGTMTVVRRQPPRGQPDLG
jgi:hypothetical protein